jgi:hypothetical protein
MPDLETKHCNNLAADRKIGAHWERMFCLLAANYNKTFTPMQIGRDKSAQAYERKNGKWNQWTLPDVAVWTCPGEHHEIKHKSPTKHGSIGLEKYRLDALRWFAEETGQAVQYTIHRHDLNGGRENRENRIEHWFTADIPCLCNAIKDGQTITRTGPTYVNGSRKEVPIVYWPVTIWIPLHDHWQLKG